MLKRLKDIIQIRSRSEPTPRMKKRTVAPRVTERIEERVEPTYRDALEDYKKHYSDVVPEVMKKFGHEPIGNPPFPEGEPELRIVDRIMGSEGLQGMSLVEELDGVHSVVNISEAVARDLRKVSFHELFHCSLSQRGIDLGDEEEDMAEEAARMFMRRTE